MRVLVTGSSGYIGGKCVDALCEKGWVSAVVGVDINLPERTRPKFTFYRRDIRQPMDDLFEREAVDTIIHAAYVVSPIHNNRLTEDINKNGTQNVLNSASKFRVHQILYTSSTTAYGLHADNDTPLIETSALRGNDDFTYAKNKKEIEAAFSTFSAANPSIKISIIRPCFVIGPNFLNPLASYLQSKLFLMPKNEVPWQFVHEDDLVAVVMMLIEKRQPGIYNVCGEGTMTLREMAESLGNWVVTLPWSFLYRLNSVVWFLRLSFMTKAPSPALNMAVYPCIASSEKLIRETGYRFKYATREAFETFAESVRSKN